MIIDATHIIGRGIVLLCEGEETDFHAGDTIELTISGVERWDTIDQKGSRIGLIVNPNIKHVENKNK